MRNKPFAEDRQGYFLQMLRQLGGSVGVSYCCRDARGGGIQEIQAVFVSCPRNAWVQLLGEPKDIRKYFDAASGRWIWSWEHSLPEGSVRCRGLFFTRSPGSDWIVVKQLSTSQDGNNDRHKTGD
jgi:hypothetical protein